MTCATFLGAFDCAGAHDGGARDANVDPDAAHDANGGVDAAHDANGGVDAASGDAAGDAGTCNSVIATGGDVFQTCGAGSPPTQTGGTIGDGTYDLTTAVLYGSGCTSGAFGQLTLVITAVDGFAVAQVATGVVADSSTISFTTDGDQLTTSTACGGAGFGDGSYTATDDSLTLEVTPPGQDAVFVLSFVKR